MQDLLLIRFQQLDLPFLGYVHSYLPIEELNEANTYTILRFLEFRNPGLRVVVPKADFESGELTNYLYEERTALVKNKYGILEPESGTIIPSQKMDLVLVPLLAFDRRGYRVGYGKGLYDRFLQGCRPDALKIGLSFFEAVDHIDDTADFDIPLTHCVTPEKVYEF